MLIDFHIRHVLFLLIESRLNLCETLFLSLLNQGFVLCKRNLDLSFGFFLAIVNID